MPISYKHKIYTTLGTPTDLSGDVVSITDSAGVPTKDYTVKGKTIVDNDILKSISVDRIETKNQSGETKFVNIPSSKYFPDGMRSAGSAYDEINFLSQKAIKRIGVVDLGTLNWLYTSVSKFFYVSLPDAYPFRNQAVPNMICEVYEPRIYAMVATASAPDGGININGQDFSPPRLSIKDRNYSDAAAFKAAMSGVMLYYELATPVETAITPPLQALSTFKGFTSFSTPNSLTQNGPLSVTYYAEGGANPEKGWLTSYKNKTYVPADDIQNIQKRNEYPIKSQISVNYNGTNVAFDVLDYDKHDLVDKDTTKTMCVGAHDVINYGKIQFCAPQLMYWSKNGLPAGHYKFTLDHAAYASSTQYDGTYMFTLTQAIPADGGFRHTNIGNHKPSYTQGDVIGNYITTYGARPRRVEVEKSVAVNIWDGTTACTDLGTFTARSRTYYVEDDAVNGGKRNVITRNYYGSNRWRDSVIRQWLNSDAEAVPSSDTATVSNWWKPATVFDRVPGGAKLAGFLHGLDSEFVAVLGTVEVKTALCAFDRVDGATYDITHDKVWLQSVTEVFDMIINGIADGSQLAYWVDASDADRIKYEGSDARYWFLRSTYPNDVINGHGVSSLGAHTVYSAYDKFGVVPTFCIKQYDGIKPIVSYKRKIYTGNTVLQNIKSKIKEG